jgi:hypothetical protein
MVPVAMKLVDDRRERLRVERVTVADDPGDAGVAIDQDHILSPARHLCPSRRRSVLAAASVTA